VRPESLRVGRRAEPGAAALTGEVTATMVIGPAVQCVVRVENGQEVLVRQQRTGASEAESLREGDRVVVSWAEDAALELD